MEGRICCAYNVSRSKEVASRVAVAERADQPLTVMRLLVECLGFKAQTALWLVPLQSPPQLVRPFPFDLVYLDAKLQVVRAVELLPEVPFPKFEKQVASALILPVRTISATGIKEGDELTVCSREELQARLAQVATPVLVGAALEATEPAAGSTVAPPLARSLQASAAPVEPTPMLPGVNPAPLPFAPIRTSGVTQSTAFTVGVTTSWHLANSTFEAALPAESGAVEPAESPVSRAAGTEVQAEEEPEQAIAKAAARAAKQSKAGSPEVAIGATAAASAPEEVRQAAEPAEAKTPQTENEISPKLSRVAGVFEVEERPIAETKPSQGVAPHAAPAAREAAANPALGWSTSKPPVAQAKSTQRGGAKVEPARPAPAVVQRPGKEEVRKKWPIVQQDAKPPVETARPGKQSRKSFGFLVKEFLNCPDPLPENRLCARLVQQGMVVYERRDKSSAPMQVRDVSPGGFYVLTKNRWQPGSVISFTLERSGAREDEYQSRVDVQGAVVRSDKDGVGLKWVLPNGVAFEPWDRLNTKRSDESDLQYFIRELRLAKAQGFLQKISPLAKSEIRHALHERLSNKRIASAVEIALQAEGVLSRSGQTGKVLAHSDVVMRIVESGSWIEDNWIRTMWAGLLVSACTTDGQDTSNLTFIDLLARQTPVHLRILSHVCKRAEEAVAAGAPLKSVEVLCTAQELTDAADSHSLARIHQTVGQLANSGLIVESARPSYASVLDKEKTKATPTALGFSMYLRCHGRRS